jgi:hypothetical protein
MSTSSTANTKSNNNNSCQRAVDGNGCMTFTIEIDPTTPHTGGSGTFDLTSPTGPDITNQQSDKPLKQNAQTALENALAQALADALAQYIRERWDTFYFENGQSFEVCADFAATIDAESGGGATADVDIGNVDISPQ